MERKVTGTILVLVSIIGCHRNDMSEIPQGLRADAEKYYEKYTAGEFMDEDFQIEVWSHKLPVTIVARDHNYYGFAKRHPGFARTWIVSSGKFQIYDLRKDDLLFIIIDPVFYDSRFIDKDKNDSEKENPKRGQRRS